MVTAYSLCSGKLGVYESPIGVNKQRQTHAGINLQYDPLVDRSVLSGLTVRSPAGVTLCAVGGVG